MQLVAIVTNLRQIAVVLLVALLAPATAAARAAPMALTEQLLRLPAPGELGRLSLEVDPLAKRITITTSPATAKRLALDWQRRLATPCLELALSKAGLELRCTSPRIAAVMVYERGERMLDVRALRGLPWATDADDVPEQALDPRWLGLGRCPGDSPAAIAECAPREQSPALALARFEAALADPKGRDLMLLRLGDELVRAGRPEEALGRWGAIQAIGPVGRQAAARLCELGGVCFDIGLAATFDPAGIPEPWRTEMELRRARVRAYLGELELAATTLAERNRDLAATCQEPNAAFCRRIALAAMEDEAPSTQAAGLELYLGLQGRARGPLAIRMARAGALVAERLEAPRFAANLLASTIEEVKREELLVQLADAARLYDLAGDRARADVIREYASSRGDRLPGVPGNTAAARAEPAELPALPPTSVTSDEELARAALALARARLQARTLDAPRSADGAEEVAP